MAVGSKEQRYVLLLCHYDKLEAQRLATPSHANPPLSNYKEIHVPLKFFSSDHLQLAPSKIKKTWRLGIFYIYIDKNLTFESNYNQTLYPVDTDVLVSNPSVTHGAGTTRVRVRT